MTSPYTVTNLEQAYEYIKDAANSQDNCLTVIMQGYSKNPSNSNKRLGLMNYYIKHYLYAKVD